MQTNRIPNTIWLAELSLTATLCWNPDISKADFSPLSASVSRILPHSGNKSRSLQHSQEHASDQGGTDRVHVSTQRHVAFLLFFQPRRDDPIRAPFIQQETWKQPRSFFSGCCWHSLNREVTGAVKIWLASGDKSSGRDGNLFWMISGASKNEETLHACREVSAVGCVGSSGWKQVTRAPGLPLLRHACMFSFLWLISRASKSFSIISSAASCSFSSCEYFPQRPHWPSRFQSGCRGRTTTCHRTWQLIANNQTSKC